MKKIKIVHISKYDNYGGSSFYSYRMHKNFSKFNKFQSKMFVLFKNTNEKAIHLFKFKKNNYLLNKIEFFFLNKKNKYSFYNKSRYVINHTSQLKGILDFNPHIIIIYNNSDFINPYLIRELINVYKIKVFLYLMDMELLTGGCHYNFSCRGFEKKCTKCPAVSAFLNDMPKNTLYLKKKFISNSELTFLCPNKEIFKDVTKSSLFNNKKHNNILLYLGLNLNNYRPKNFKKKKFVFSFRSSLNPRKGQELLKNALTYICDKNSKLVKKIHFNIIGDSSIKDFIEKLGFQYDYKNTISNENRLINFYQKSDFFINQSIQDVGPVMVNESLACGRPVISFDNGVSKDLIKNNYNGFLIKNFSSINLAKTIIKIVNFQNIKIILMKKNARKTAKKYLNIKKQIKNIIKS